MFRDLINNINNLCNKYNCLYENFILYIEIKKLLQNINNNILLELDNYNYENIININGYTKYIIYSSDIFDMILIKWNKNNESKIHDHPERGCVMKILSGKLCENIYDKIHDNKINLIESQILNTNDIGYKISNRILHKIIALEDTYSIHIYIPGKYKPTYY